MKTMETTHTPHGSLIERQDDDPVQSLSIYMHEQPISWSRTAKGSNILAVRSHAVSRWVKLAITETPKGGNTRRTSIELREAEARALYEHLRLVFGASAP